MNVILIGEGTGWLFFADSAVAGVFSFSPPVKFRDVYVPRIFVTVTKSASAVGL